MKSNSKKTRLEVAIDDLEKIRNSHECCSEELTSTIKQLKDVSSEHQKANRGINRLFYVIMFLFATAVTYIFMLQDRNEALCISISNLEHRDSLLYELMGADSTKSLSWRVHTDGRPITYKQLEHSVDSLSEYKIFLELIKKNYPIKTKKVGNTYSISSEKIDSALMLLPTYRDMLYFDAKEKVWIITRDYIR